ncbi:MAG: L,D-transpeptidase family protein [Patescibacteria group bacterium]|nr:L,D-transpeptidase family protein [Patescibacteria group bacterium]
MATPDQLADYINNQLKRGVSYDQIKSALNSAGWQSQDIENAFNLVGNKRQRNGVLHKNIPFWAVVLIIGLIIVVFSISFAAIFFNFRKTVYNYQFSLPSTSAQVTSYAYGSWPALDNANFYNQVLENFINKKITFININLSTMQLQLYNNGVKVKQIQVLSKGRPGSWWETPAGLYKVEEKVPVDYSSFANVYMDWGIVFEGNFLIHGWPYYPDGTPVNSQFSGGCIRLSTADAKSLYGQVNIGTPILVSSANFQTDNFQEQYGPSISAESFLAADLKSNFIFTEKNSDQQLPIASITKLMTALVAVEYVNIENKITITPEMLVKTSIPRLRVGESISLYDLLHLLLKESSNEAAVAISYFLGPERFVQIMNQKAEAIGMTNTHFVDVSGSDWGDVSTAKDLFMLAQYLYNNRSFILKMTTNSTDSSVYGPSVFANLQNFNVFTDNPDFIGGKVGINGAASGTIISVFQEPFQINTATSSNMNINTSSTSISASVVQRPIMFVILGSDDYSQDAKNMLSWIKNTYK